MGNERAVGPKQPEQKTPEQVLEDVIEIYFGDAYRGYFAGHDTHDRIGAVYHMLQESGQDAVGILMEAGLIIGEEDEI